MPGLESSQASLFFRENPIMSYLVIGPLVGIALVIVISLVGVGISEILGGNAPTFIAQAQTSASVILLTTILARLAGESPKE